MIKYILAGTATTAVAATVGFVVLKKDLACEYSPINLSSVVNCEQFAKPQDAKPDNESGIAAAEDDEKQPVKVAEKANTTPATVEEEKQTEPVAGKEAKPTVPTFDVVRVEPDGSTLVAGRGTPNSTIILKNGDKNIGEAVASPSGEWVIIVEEPIQDATATLSLMSILQGGETVVSDAVVNIAMRQESKPLEVTPIIVQPVVEIKVDEAAEAIIEEKIADLPTEVTGQETGDTETSEAVAKTIIQAEKVAEEAEQLLAKIEQIKQEAENPIVIMVEAEPIVEVEPETIVEAEPVVEIEPEIVVKAEPVVEVEPEIIIEVEPETIVEAEPAVKIKPEAETMVETVVNVVENKVTELVNPNQVVKIAAKTPVIVNTPTEIETKVIPFVAEKTETVVQVTEPVIDVKTEPRAAPKPVAIVVEKKPTPKPAVKVAVKTAPKPVAKTAAPKPVDNTPLVVITQKGQPAKILQGAGIGSKKNEMTFNSMDYSDKGEIIFSGDAAAGELVRVYVNNKFVGEATADSSGNWALNNGFVMQSGKNSMRFDQVNASGTVVSRRETKITMPKLAQQTASVTPKTTEAKPNAEVTNEVEQPKVKGGRAIIIWGDNLWNISRKIYGKGELYTTIFKANKDQIRNPDLIYPGQVFILPPAEVVAEQ